MLTNVTLRVKIAKAIIANSALKSEQKREAKRAQLQENLDYIEAANAQKVTLF